MVSAQVQGKVVRLQDLRTNKLNIILRSYMNGKIYKRYTDVGRVELNIPLDILSVT